MGHLATYKNRTIYYACDLITKDLEKGDDYSKMNKGIVISFIKGSLFPEKEQFHSVYAICDKDTGEPLSDLLKALIKEGEGVISMTDKILTKVSEEERLRHARFSREMWL